jgi:hypothetical protein
MVSSSLCKESFIEREVTNVIKGICLVFMFIHHFFTFPDWHIDGISYPELNWFASQFQSPMKICVCVFSFLTGYSYYYTKQKTYRYSIKKLTDVWVSYLITFFVLLIPAIVLKVYDFSIKNFILELFALRTPTMRFCWYVVYYITAMLILPLYYKYSEKAPMFCFCMTLIAPRLLLSAADSFVPDSLKGFNQIIEYMCWFPTAASGLLFAKYGLFHEFSNLLRTKNKTLNIAIACLLICMALQIRNFSTAVDFATAPVFVYGIVEIYRNIKIKEIFAPLKLIGKYSLLMWFAHCVFFNSCEKYTQPILYFPMNPILVTAWGLLLCLIAAAIINIPVECITKAKNKLFNL